MLQNRFLLVLQLLLLFLGSTIAAQNTEEPILLPIEVLGEEGVIEEIEFSLSTAIASKTDKIWLQVNNLSYQDKASVKVNDEEWYSLNHNSCYIYSPEKERGGMTHGGHNTIRLSFPTNGISNGINKIKFRFNTSDGISNGYRVVRFNLLDTNNNQLLDSSFFKEDDPKDWKAPYTDALKIQRGKDLWYYANLESNYLPIDRKGSWYGYSFPSKQPIKAKCASCHTQDGRDLEIFSYSNKSIIERAKFHNLTEEDGKMIASYIRSLSEEHDNVGRYGRPWNPPYQPGHELKDKPIEQWAAGAGLDAVLEADKDMLPYMFPTGATQETVYDRFDSDKMVDRTLLPLAIQLPDWKHWLPIIHPMDAYSKDDYWENPVAFGGRPNIHPKQGYINFRNFLEEMPVSQRNPNRLMQQNREFWYHYRFFLAQRNDGNQSLSEHWREPKSMATTKLAEGIPRELAATSLARLMAVQYFEVMNEFNLQDKAHWFAKPEDQPGVRQWFGENYQVFEVPPHFQACVSEQELPINDGYNIIGNCLFFHGQSQATGAYESTAWYHLQLVVNGGNGMVSHNSPMDYNYHPDFIVKASSTSGIYEPLRYYHSMNAMYQFRSWSGATTPNDGKGFRIRVQGPWHIIGRTDSNQLNDFTPSSWPKLLDNLENGMSTWVLNAQLRQFLKEVQKPENNLENWNRLQNGGSNELDAISKTTEQLQDMTYFVGLYYHADKFYYLIPEFAKLGVDCQILEELINWCSEAWPNINWDSFRQIGELQLQLLPNENVSCATTANTIIAKTVNEGDSPQFEWWINDEKIDEDSNQLDISNYKANTKIRCRVTSNKSCITNNWLEKEITISETSVQLEMSVNNEDWQPLNNSILCINYEVNLRTKPIVGNPLFWLDATDVNNNGTKPEEGDVISLWKNKSNSGYEMPRQYVANIKPIYTENGINNKPALLFGEQSASGLPLFSINNNTVLDGDWTFIITGKYSVNANGDWNALLGNEDGNSGFGFYFDRRNREGRTRTKVNGNQQHGRIYTDGTEFVTVITKKDNTIQIHINGRLEEEIETSSNRISNHKIFYLGQKDGGAVTTQWYHKGPITEVLFYDRAISNKQQSYLEGYLMHKWGFNQKIPLDHPFKKNSPLAIDLKLPNTDVLTFDNSIEKTIQFTNNSNFGNYEVFRKNCNTSINTFVFQESNNLPSEFIKYSVNTEKYKIGSSVNISIDSTLDLDINYVVDADYQWENSRGELLPLNTKPIGFKITAEDHLTVWKLHLYKKDNSCLVDDTIYEFKINVEGILSVDQFYKDVSIYPNPTKGIIFIKVPNVLKNTFKITVYNSLQQEVFKKTFKESNTIYKISLNDKPAGFYFIKLHLEKPIVFKVIKN